MGVFKTTNHMVRLGVLPYCTSCPCSSYFAVGFLHHLTSFSLKVSNFSTSHPRLLSSDTPNSILMELVQKVAHRGSTAPESIAIRYDKKSHTYHQLIASAKNISNLLSNADLNTVNGHGKDNHLGGARVGIVAKPSPEFVAGLLGTWFSGGVAVPLALSYPEAELLHVMNDADITMILSTEDHQDIMKAVAAKTSAQLSLLPAVSSTRADHTSLPETDVSHLISGDDPALIIYTSGTTGKPKGVVHTHEGILAQNFHPSTNKLAQILQLSLLPAVSSTRADHTSLPETDVSHSISGDDPALIIYTSGTTGKPKGVVHTHEGILAQVRMLTDAWAYTSDDQFLHSLPLHHVHGLFNALLAPLHAGSTVEFMPKFSVRGIWQRWRESYPKDQAKTEDAITVFTGVPTMYTRLIQGYEAMDAELQTASATAARQLRLMMCGSSALPLPVMQQWESITGHLLLERYGMTEFVMALSNPLHGKRKGGTVGNPLPGVQAKILSEDGSTNADVGDLYIKSPSLFKEYWKLPQVTKESFIDGGFFKTGDAARVDEDGYYVILGRTNADIMKVGGYKLSALEIEAVLLEHTTVSECCVLGLPDKDYGEAICAIVIPDAEIKRKRDEELKPALTLEELTTWAKERLAPYKIPTRLLLWESLPRNAMGKVNKKDLKKKLAE